MSGIPLVVAVIMIASGAWTSPYSRSIPIPMVKTGKPSCLDVDKIMTTELVTARSDTALVTVLNQLSRNKIRHMPIVDPSNVLRGIISKRDMLNAHLVQKTLTDERLAGQIMTRDLTTVRPDDCAYAAAKIMLKHKFGSLPVVDDTGHLIGIITEADFVRLFTEQATCDCPIKI